MGRSITCSGSGTPCSPIVLVNEGCVRGLVATSTIIGDVTSLGETFSRLVWNRSTGILGFSTRVILLLFNSGILTPRDGKLDGVLQQNYHARSEKVSFCRIILTLLSILGEILHLNESNKTTVSYPDDEVSVPDWSTGTGTYSGDAAREGPRIVIVLGALGICQRRAWPCGQVVISRSVIFSML